MTQSKFVFACFLPVLTLLTAGPQSHAQQNPKKPMVFEGTAGGWRIIEEGQPPVMIHPRVEDMSRLAEASPHKAPGHGGTGGQVIYNGGVDGIGVETNPKVYLVLWGSQWNGNDPSGEAAILEYFYQGVGGSSWVNTVTQYCEGVSAGTVTCGGAGTPAGNAVIFAGVWADNATAAPSQPKQSEFGPEAERAAQHFGNTTPASNVNAQYVIATATGNGAKGFTTQYCAYHSWSSSKLLGNVSFTNLPYITDAGVSCGANISNLGANAGITIVGGHEMAESITDPFFTNSGTGGWFDSSGNEIGDKCAWITSGQGAIADIALPTGTFPVQSLWSNAFNGNTGGCVITFP